MANIDQVALSADWDAIADAVAFTIGHNSPTHRAAVDAMKGFPDAVERFSLHLENEPEDRRDALAARLRAFETRNGGLPLS
jgi:hypothetical protein